MNRFRRTLGLVRLGLALALASLSPVWAAGDEGSSSLCKRLSHEGEGYVVCEVDLRRQEVKLHWMAPDGRPYGNFGRLIEAQANPPIVVAMNAGMYQEDLSPVGLYVENGRELKRANTANGAGNFHLKPNGVFYLAKGQAGILETGRYLKRRPAADYATQSGPMLVIGGKLHPKFSDEGPSRKIRNGVGVQSPTRIVLAISDGPVSFGAFARLFRDVLECRDALFLDGSISSLYAPALGRRDGFLPFGPMITVQSRPDEPGPATRGK